MATVETRAGKDGKPRYLVRYVDPSSKQRAKTYRLKRDADTARAEAHWVPFRS